MPRAASTILGSIAPKGALVVYGLSGIRLFGGVFFALLDTGVETDEKGISGEKLLLGIKL